ncbi:hypothetical protein [Aliiruegeria sabulilitoris]|uniref:hypothetical protein n=1 Tax=Aliiruegeria sabulilitoris TaxID=1510458 RepID=UPI0012E3E18E|nr:hypothetical protein [Aliiruegeria sabulilitoris]NDR58837.1 hypothetical protein [Pseudoruegeria sp. M32A2M]
MATTIETLFVVAGTGGASFGKRFSVCRSRNWRMKSSVFCAAGWDIVSFLSLAIRFMAGGVALTAGASGNGSGGRLTGLVELLVSTRNLADSG